MAAKTVFQWSHYLALADEWMVNAATSQHPEAVYRSLISRAYYAVFHASFDLAQTLGLESTQSASEHYRVRKFFGNPGRVAAQLNQKLRSLYDWRVSADYIIEAENPVTKNGQAIAQQTLLDAHKAMELIGYLRPKAKRQSQTLPNRLCVRRLGNDMKILRQNHQFFRVTMSQLKPTQSAHQLLA